MFKQPSQEESLGNNLAQLKKNKNLPSGNESCLWKIRVFFLFIAEEKAGSIGVVVT